MSFRECEENEELLAASHLRAISFYAYPPERALAGKVSMSLSRLSALGVCHFSPSQQYCQDDSRPAAPVVLAVRPPSRALSHVLA